MAKVKIDRKRCKGCRLCIVFCPQKNIKLDDKLNEAGIFPAAVVVEDDCTGCGMCYVMCPDVCIEIEKE
jgi:2-oxoglutarate ferredoxin oxidoreductase subunit delta